MKRKPTHRKRETLFATFTPKPEPLFEIGGKYTLIDGTPVTVRIIEWLKDKWVYYLIKHAESAILRRVSVLSQAEFVSLTGRKAVAA